MDDDMRSTTTAPLEHQSPTEGIVGPCSSPCMPSPMATKASSVGHSPMPSIIKEHNVSADAVVGWGNPADVKQQLSRSTGSSPAGSFKRTTTSTMPNLVALATRPKPSSLPYEDVCATPTTASVLSLTTSDGKDAASDHDASEEAGWSCSSSEHSPASTGASPSAHGSTATGFVAVAEWQSTKRADHATRLQRAAAKASKQAARKMMAMAKAEELRASNLPPVDEDALVVNRSEAPNLERVLNGLLRNTLRVLGCDKALC